MDIGPCRDSLQTAQVAYSPLARRGHSYSIGAVAAPKVLLVVAHPVIASGIADDPETGTARDMCGTVVPNSNLLGVLLATLNGDQLHGLGGADYLV